MAWRDQGYLTVLVIDDDPELRTIVQAVVLGEGHQAMAVGSAEAGLELLPLNTFDVAFLDQRLPGMEGLVLGEYLHKNNPEMEIALVTGDADERLVRVAASLGLTVITKPFEADELIAVLDTAVKRQEAAQKTAAAAGDGDGPIDLVPCYPHLPELFALPSVSQRLEDLLARRIRESLEALQLVDARDEKARAVAYSGLVAAQVLGVKLPRTKSGTSYVEWYDALMAESGRPPAFGTQT